jgi:glycosyltransferase involved in cell wall biosynthesis
MLRIALFTETFLPKVDGIVNTLCHLLDHLAEREHASLLFAPQGALERYAKTTVVTLPAAPWPPYPEFKIAWPFANARPWLESFQPDVMHLVNPVFMGVVGLRAAKQLGLPIVASYQTDLPGFARRWGWGITSEAMRVVTSYQMDMPGFARRWGWGIASEAMRVYLRWLHNQCDLNLTPSCFTRAELQADGFRRVKVWTRGVDTAHYHPNRRSLEWRQRLSGSRPDGPLLLYVGRLAPEKRIEWLRPVLDAVPEARLAIVGDGPSRPALEQLFAGTNTTFTGYLHGDDLAHAYASADVFAFPAANETLGNVVLEAMASGLPIVAPHSGGLLDHVQDGKHGLLFAPESPTEMVEATRRLARDAAYARQLGAQGRRYAETRVWADTLDGLLQDYASVIARQSRRKQIRLSASLRRRGVAI